jgi:two-component system response regulator FixJ
VDQFNRRMVFVVDDDDAVRDSMCALLESAGIVVRDYASANDFLQSMSLNSTGCLLLDLHMPGMSGIELLERLRAEGNRIPVIVMTGRSDPALKERVIRGGALELLDKPVDEAMLMNALDRAFMSPVSVA